jgi:hypothetical protein
MSANFEVGLNVEVNGSASIEKFKKSLGDLAKNSDKVAFSQEKTRNGVTKLVASFKNLDATDAKLIRRAMDKTNGNAKYIKSVKNVESATENLTEAVKDNSKAVEHNTDSTKDNEKAQEQETESTKKSAKETKAATRELEKKAKALARAAEETRRYEAAKKHLEDRERIMTEAHRKRQNIISRNANYVQGRIEETDNRRVSGQHSVISSQAAAAQTRHNNAMLKQQTGHQLTLQRMQAAHQLTLQRMAASGRTGGGGMFGGRGSVGTGAGFVGNVNSLPGVGKVIVYDALRRILTNIYQTVGKVGDEIVQWTKESIQFNDEMARAQTVFRGFGLIGQKNADGKSMSIADARANPAMGSAMMKIDKFSEKMMNTMTDLSMMTGQDTEEIVASARQLTADLINKKSGPGGKSPILDDKMGAELVATTEAMVGLAAVLKASDPGGRALKFHMVGLQELFSGSSGNSKDKGMANVKSLMLREGIRIKEKEAAPIAAAVNKGDITKASELIQEVLDRAGQSTVTFKNLLANTLMPNIDAIKTAFKKLSGVFHAPLFDFILDQAIRYREVMRGLMKSDAFNALMKKYGVEFKKAFFPIIAPISDFFDKIKKTDGAVLKPYIETFLSVTKNFNIIFANFITGFVGFFNGLLGVNSKEAFNAEPIKKFSAQFAGAGEQMGANLRKLSENLGVAMEPVMDQFFPAMIAIGDTFVALTKLISPFTRALAALAYEITNMPLVGTFIKSQLGDDNFKETKNNLYDFAYTDGKDTSNFDAMGAGIAGIMSPVKLFNMVAGISEPGNPLININGEQLKTPWGTNINGSMAMAEFYKRNEAPYGTVEQNADARIANQAREKYEQSQSYKDEPWRKGAALGRIIAANRRLLEGVANSEGGLMPGGRGYEGPSRTMSKPSVDDSVALAFTKEYTELVKKFAAKVPKNVVKNSLNDTINSINADTANRKTVKPVAPPKTSAVPAPVNYVMQQIQKMNPMAYYDKMTTPSKAPYDMPKPTVPKASGISDKEFVTISNKVVAEKLKSFNKPFIVKPDKVHTETNITIGTVHVNANDAKQFTENLKNSAGVKTQSQGGGKQSEIPATYSTQLGKY